MPNINPKVPGDIIYPDYAVQKPEPVSAIAIVKGRLYTKGSAAATGNQLAAAGATGFINGIYQPTTSIETAGTAGQHRVECLGRRSRVLLKAKDANLHAGQVIIYNHSSHDVSLYSNAGSAPTVAELNARVGTIYRIYTRGEINAEKDVTAAGDFVEVELGIY